MNNRISTAITLLLSLNLVSSCSWFWKDEFLLPGERADVFPTTQNAETNLNPKAALPTKNNNDKSFGGGVKTLWSASVGSTGNRHQTHSALPNFSGNMIYVLDNSSKVTALTTSGKTAWRGDIRRKGDSARVIGGGLRRAGNAIYVGTGTSEVVKLSANSGKIQWRNNVDAPIRSAPIVSGGNVYAQSFGNKIYAFNTADGSEIWRYEGAGYDKNGAQTSTQPILTGGKLIAYLNTGEIIALNPKTGEALWQENVFSNRAVFSGGSNTAPQSQLIQSSGLVIAGSVGAETAAINPNSGSKVWSRKFGVASNIAASGGRLYLIDENQNVRAINASNGQDIWSYSLPAYENFEKKKDKYHWFGPAVSGNELFVVSNRGNVVVVSTSGKPLRGSKMRTKFSATPTVHNGVVYAINDDGKILALR